MALPRPLSRALTRLAALLVGVVTVGLVGMPVAHASTFSVDLVLTDGQPGSIGRLVSNTDVTPVSSCDPELSVSFDATMAGTVIVAADARLATYTCSVDFQLAGQSTGLVEQVSVRVVPGPSVDDVTLVERSLGPEPFAVSPDGVTIPPTLFTFTVTLPEALSSTVVLAASTEDGTARGESVTVGSTTISADYVPVDTTLRFPPGVTSQTVTVEVIRDDVKEADETFFVNLSAVSKVAIVDGQGVGTILNDDNPGPISAFP